MAGLGGQQFKNLGKLPNHWNDRDQIWHMYTDSSGNGHRLNNYPLDPQGAFGGGQGVTNSKNVGKMPKSCTDRDQIWHTYAYSSGNGHKLKQN